MSNRNLTPAEIQKILEEQRATAEIYKKTEKQLNYTISLKDRELDPAYQETKRLKIHSPEANAKRSATSKQTLSNPIVKEKMKEGQRRVRESIEYKEKMKAVYADPEVIRKRIEAGRTQCKEIVTPDGVFPSLASAAKFYKIHTVNMRLRVKNYPHLYYYSNTGPGNIPEKKPKIKKLLIKPVICKNVCYVNIYVAAQELKIHADTIKYRIKKHPAEYYYITQEEYERLTNSTI